MTEAAKIMVLRGPDEGKVFSLTAEMVNVGRGDENEVVLADESLDDYLASIVRKNGRYAIYTPLENGVQVDGNGIPSDQWVWLPEAAELKLQDSTVLLFRAKLQGADEPASNGDAAAAPPVEPPPRRSRTRKSSRKGQAKGQSGSKGQSGKKGRKVARFITDRGGDRLVRLGDDGKLPQLALADADAPKKKTAARQSGQGASPLLYVALGVSVLMSFAMLLIDDSAGSTASQRADALRRIAKFYGEEGQALKPYQKYLREARRAYRSSDVRAELRAYQRVLDELNAEDVARSLNGLTGDTRTDDELRELIGILLDRPR